MKILIHFFTVLLIFAIGWLIVPHLSYLKWDNFEFIVPAIIDAHQLWFEGILPVWSKYVHLGDPIISNGQLGAFYFPHTLVLLLLKVFSLPYETFPLISLILHSFIAVFGWTLLLTDLRMPRYVVQIAFLSIVFGGMLQFNSQIWTDMLPCWTWFPFLLLGIERRSVLITAVAVTAAGSAAHPQQFIYFLTFYGIWCLVTSVILSRRLGFFKETLFGAACGLLLSCPSILPILAQKSYSARSGKLPLEEFLSRGVSWQDWLGIVNPFLVGTKSVMPIAASLLLFQGFLILPGIIFGLVSLKKNKINQSQRYFIAFLIAGVAGLILSMGGNTFLYKLTYSIPIWSSLRWPFKMLYFCLPLIACAGAIGFSLISNFSKTRLNMALALSCTLFVISFLSIRDQNFDLPTGKYLLIVSAIFFIAPFILPKYLKSFRNNCLILSCVLSSLALLYLTQLNPNKVYSEKYSSVSKASFGIKDDSKILPLSTLSEPFEQQSLALMHSGPMNHYESAGGCVTALAPSWRLRALPSDVYGVPSRPYAFKLLNSKLINSMNIGYVVIDKSDSEMLNFIEKLDRYHRKSETPRSIVFENMQVLDKAFFATNAVFESDLNYDRVLFSQRLPSTDVVSDLTDSYNFSASSKIQSFQHLGGRIKIAVTSGNDMPQLLVVAATWYPSWSVYVDGYKENVVRVNGTLLGVLVKEGKTFVEFKWEDPMLRAGFILAVLGAALMSAWYSALILRTKNYSLFRKK